jgi:hypothetical protein
MKKPRTLTRIAASLLLLPILHLAVKGLFYGILILDGIRWPDYIANLLYAIFVFMAMFIPYVTIGSSVLGIILQAKGIRNGENKKIGIWVISACILLIVLLIAACTALMWSLIASGGIGS